eukprot:m.59961 g.59961  ORF g.59961 m.59961 type:complete len:226 (+) comp11342_c0_seq8:802-1479(+)
MRLSFEPLHPIQDRGGVGVHLVSGACALAGVYVIGPRRFRFRQGMLVDIKPHSLPLVLLGGFFAFIGLMALNTVANRDTFVDTTGGEGRAIVNAVAGTFIAATGGGLTVPVMRFFQTRRVRLQDIVYGLLVGCVAISGDAQDSELWAALLIGCIAGALQHFASRFVRNRQLDDACDVVSIHLVGALWGLIAHPLLKQDTGIVYSWVCGVTVCLCGCVCHFLICVH